jgi:hypothetical protein
MFVRTRDVSFHVRSSTQFSKWEELKILLCQWCRFFPYFYQCCGSGMFIPGPEFYPSRIPDLKTATKERGEKKLYIKPFYVATKFNKIVNFFSFAKEKNLGQFSKNYRTFYQKTCQKALQNMVLGSGKNPYRIPDPGVKKAPYPDPQHLFLCQSMYSSYIKVL